MNFTLRAWHMSDLESLVHHANNFNISKFMTDGFPHPYTEASGKSFIDFATKGNPIHIFAIDVNGKAVGGIGIHPQQDIMKKNAELGYWLSEAYWGHGIISRAIPQVVQLGFEHFDIARIYARPFGRNLKSQHLLEKSGFKLEARFEHVVFKNGEFDDELVYSIRKERGING